LVTLAVGVHPVPSRTRPLSPPAPMVLGAQAPGRLGRRQPPARFPPPFKILYLSDLNLDHLSILRYDLAAELRRGVAQLGLARLHGVQEVPGSNPGAPTLF
jgi:hypothetical protein